MKIGVFDSGRGGEYIAQGLRLLLPNDTFMVVNDSKNVPYGSRTEQQIIALTTTAIQPLITAGCRIIVIACNTATMVAIRQLRQQFPHITFVGTDPMVKPAAQHSTARHITVLATPRTLASQRYQQLVRQYAADIIIDQPDTSSWATCIESGNLAVPTGGLSASIAAGSDTIVLACTHYIALASQLQAQFPHATILEPTHAIARQITRVK